MQPYPEGPGRGGRYRSPRERRRRGSEGLVRRSCPRDPPRGFRVVRRIPRCPRSTRRGIRLPRVAVRRSLGPGSPPRRVASGVALAAIGAGGDRRAGRPMHRRSLPKRRRSPRPGLRRYPARSCALPIPIAPTAGCPSGVHRARAAPARSSGVRRPKRHSVRRARRRRRTARAATSCRAMRPQGCSSG